MHEPEDITEVGLPDYLIQFEGRLAALAAEPPRIDRDELMFAAGFAARGSSAGRWAWPLATTISSAAAAVFAVMLVTTQPAQKVVAPLAEAEKGVNPPLAPERVDLSRTPVVRTRPMTMLGRGSSNERPWASADDRDWFAARPDNHFERKSGSVTPSVTMRELMQEFTAQPGGAWKST